MKLTPLTKEYFAKVIVINFEKVIWAKLSLESSKLLTKL
jgi:hypothetical protein